MADNEQKPNPDPSLQKMGRGMFFVGWIFVLGILTFAFSDWEKKQFNPNPVPLSSSTDDVNEVKLKRNRYGHYVATGFINGVAVDFLLDTGATNVAVPAHIAEEIGLNFGPPRKVYTANGVTEAYMTEIEEISLGDISLKYIEADITPNMSGDEVLLGMAFLRYIDFSQQADVLTLKQYTYSPSTI